MQVTIGIYIWNNIIAGGGGGANAMSFENLVNMEFENGVEMDYET